MSSAKIERDDCERASGMMIQPDVAGNQSLHGIKNEPILQVASLLEKEEVTKAEMLNIFPNPNEGKFTLVLDEEYQQSTVDIIDVWGKTLYQKEQSLKYTDFDLSLQSGVYYLKIIDHSNQKTLKFIIR